MRSKSMFLAAFAAASLTAGAASACPTHAVPLPAGPAADGKPGELLDTPFVKLVTFTVRAGQKLAGHKVPQAVTIQALGGRGTVKTGDQVDPLSPGQLVLVAPGAEHEVIAEKGQDLVLLVHVLKGAAAADGNHDHHGHGEGAHPAPGKTCTHCAGAPKP